VGWTISPSAAVLLPDIVDYYYSTAATNDEFVAAVSGVGYTYPQQYGKRYRRPGAVFDGFLDQTARYMSGMDLRAVNPTGAGPQEIARYAERIPGLQGIFADYGRTVDTYDEATFVTAGNTPVFHAVTGWVPKGGREAQIAKMVEQISAIAPAAGPGFLHAFACNWFYDVPALQEVMRRLGPRYVAVTPAHLAALYRQHLERVQLQVRMPPTIGAIEGRPVAVHVPVRNVSSRPMPLRFAAEAPGGSVRAVPASVVLRPAGETEVTIKGSLRGDRLTFSVSGPIGRRKFASAVLLTRRSELVGRVALPGMQCAAVFEGEALPGLVGAVAADATASGGRVRVAARSDTKPGFMSYGPYRPFKAGR
jgi:hypothetical protein